MHHAWIGGLLEHVVDLIRFCDLAASHFPLIHRDLLLTGAILHDIGKIYELSWERGFEYTLEGQLIGHISIATRLLDEKVKSLPGFPEAGPHAGGTYDLEPSRIAGIRVAEAAHDSGSRAAALSG